MKTPRGTARALRRAFVVPADPFFFERLGRPGYAPGSHAFDEDGVCHTCGFDGAEWHHWRYSTAEGLALASPLPCCPA